MNRMAVRKYFPKDVEQLVHWYQRYISPFSLIAGFLSDNFILLKRVDLLRTNLLLLFYLVMCALGITAINLIASGRVKNQSIVAKAPLIPIVVQFCFGGLFSGYLSLYSRSASLAISWIFVLLLAALLFGNERFMRFYSNFSFQISLYFGVLFSFLIFYLPVAFHAIGPRMFILSGVSSLVFVTAFLMILSHLVPEVVKKHLTVTARSIALIYIAFNLAYFNNIIPPLPLALKSAGVYHDVVHESDGTYELTGEPLPWYEAFFRYNTVFHETSNDRVYVYVSVFAPSGLTTTILHQWQYYDPSSKQWLTTDTIQYPIVGGRDGGYEGYSYKGYLQPGQWRVNVITQYGQLIGRVTFTVISSSSTPPLVTTNA